MNYARVERKDLNKLNSFLKRNTPLVGRSQFDIESKVDSDSFLLLKFFETNKIIGFVEAEFLGGGEARINCLVLDEEFRGKGFGTEIIKSALKELKKRETERVFLLVKSSNIAAKRLYEKAGFGFVGLYQDDETGESIEEMEIEFEASKPSYVS